MSCGHKKLCKHETWGKNGIRNTDMKTADKKAAGGKGE